MPTQTHSQPTSKKAARSWKDDRVLDDVAFAEQDAQLFRSLMGVPADQNESDTLAGTILRGRVVEISKDYVVVDVGLKSEGLVPAAEFTDPTELALDGEVEVLLEQAEGENGQIVLSRDKARRQRQWEYLLVNCKEGSIVTGRVIRKVKGGLMVDIGVEAFLPGSQIDNKRIKNLDEYLDKSYDFKILKINIDRKNIVISRRELLEEERQTRKTELLENIKEGDAVRGVVKNITDFGVFLELNGVDGLLHITDMTWKRIKHPSEMVAIGDELDVLVLNVDREKGRVALGLKQKEENPWEQIEERYPVGTRVQGRIVNLLPYGAFIELEPGIEGLIHVSEMSWTRNVNEPSEVVQKGQEVEAMVLAVSKEEGKISLGLKQMEKNPWDEVEKKYPVGTNVQVEIRNLTNYGAFCEIEPGLEGLIHISDLSWIRKVSHPSEVLNRGDKVDAVVLAVDKDNKRINLGIKQLSTNPWSTIEKTMPVGSIVTGKVSRIAAFGVYVTLENGLDALVHFSELSTTPFNKIEDIVKEGQEVTAKVIKLDPEHKKIALSIKDYLLDQNRVNRDEIVTAKASRKTGAAAQ